MTASPHTSVWRRSAAHPRKPSLALAVLSLSTHTPSCGDEDVDRLTGDLHPQLQVVAGDVAVRLLLQECLYLWRHSAAAGLAVETNHNKSYIIYSLPASNRATPRWRKREKSEKNLSQLTSSMKAMPGLCSGRYIACCPAAAAAFCTTAHTEQETSWSENCPQDCLMREHVHPAAEAAVATVARLSACVLSMMR